jgi:hypothetical protein
VEDRQKTIHPLVDIYSVHIQADTRELVESVNIHMHFILVGLTDKFQPLDRQIFGVLKSEARENV